MRPGLREDTQVTLTRHLPSLMLLAALAGYQFAHYQAVNLLLLCATIGLCAFAFSLAGLGRERLSKRQTLFLVVLLLFFLSSLVSYALNPGDLAAYRVKRFALVTLCGIGSMLFVYKFIPRGFEVRHFAMALVVSTLVTGPIALYLFYHVETDWRVSLGPNYPTIFGDIACLNAMLCFYLALNERHSTALKSALYLAILGALMAAYASGARGAWLGLVVLLPVIVVLQPTLPARRKLLWLLAMTLGAIGLYVTNFYIGARIDGLLQEIQNYVNTGEVRSSSGTRIEFWRASLLTLQQSPWLGAGDQRLGEAFAPLIAQGLVSESVADYVHVHNDFLQLAYSKGLPGIVLYVALLALPILVAAPPWRQMAVVLSFAYLVFGATDCLFIIEMSAIYYFLLTVILLGLRDPPRDHRSPEENPQNTARC